MTVLVEYTGDPRIYPGCERVMHRAPRSVDVVAPGIVLHRAAPRPPCGVVFEFWQMDEHATEATGWNWCPACYPGREPRSFFREYSTLNRAYDMAAARRAELDQAARLLPPKKTREGQLARVELAEKTLQLSRAELLLERARQSVDLKRIASLDADSAVLDVLFERAGVAADGADAFETRIKERAGEVAEEKEKLKGPKGLKRKRRT